MTECKGETVMLEVEKLTVYFGSRCVLEDVSLSVKRGNVLGIVGESGSGKTMTALSVMGLLSPAASITGGSIRLGGKDISQVDPEKLLSAYSIVFQDVILFDNTIMENIRIGRKGATDEEVMRAAEEAMTSLNPTMRIGKQLAEAVRLHCEKTDIKPSRAQLKSRVLDALSDVNLTEPERIYNSYPHELSGGMRQRVMIAMGTICRPGYLLCDEPTTALDVTTQKGILELIKSMKSGHNMGIVFITHDLKLLKNFADEVAVMCRGKVVERGRVEDIFMSPKEDYTKKLIAAIPDRSKKMSAGAV
jgi:ABC-type dipeptide/oligopeptide/nickel transport system ATPase component